MAYLNGDDILTRIREVLEQAAGSLRVIPTDTYHGGLWGDLSADEQSRRATWRPLTEARITSIEPHGARCSVTSNVGLLALEVEVLVTRHVGPEHMAQDTIRDFTSGAAATDADVVTQALGYPGAMDRATTGVVGGLLSYVSSETAIELATSDGSPGRLITTIIFGAVVQTAQATGA